jgi:hypothetical protein
MWSIFIPFAIMGVIVLVGVFAEGMDDPSKRNWLWLAAVFFVIAIIAGIL